MIRYNAIRTLCDVWLCSVTDEQLAQSTVCGKDKVKVKMPVGYFLDEYSQRGAHLPCKGCESDREMPLLYGQSGGLWTYRYPLVSPYPTCVG